MSDHLIIYTIFLVFAGAALIATLALYARQAMIVAYIVLGIIIGPDALGLIKDPRLAQSMADVGIVFLLFLLGLNLLPQKLTAMFRQASLLTAVSSLSFGLIGTVIAVAFGFRGLEALIIGTCMMFSSTILGLKLLPTTALHHRHAGEIIISVLLIQDIIAIVVLIGLKESEGAMGLALLRTAVALPGLIAFALLAERWLIRRLLLRFDQIGEYLFLLTVGWCVSIAQLGHAIGLSYEIGAFIAGVAMASSPISRHIAETLKPLRDFFLVLFFVAVGAGVRLDTALEVVWPALTLALVMLAIKPLVFSLLLRKQAEKPGLSMEMGVRLGQVSEFSLLIATLAAANARIGSEASHLIELSVLFSMVLSSYWIVMRYPTPIAVSDRLRRD